MSIEDPRSQIKRINEIMDLIFEGNFDTPLPLAESYRHYNMIEKLQFGKDMPGDLYDQY